MNEHACGVYYIRDDNAVYIGKTTRSFAIRWKEHITDLAAQEHSNWKLQQSYNDGNELVCGVLVELQTPELIEKAEMILIDYYKDKIDMFNIEGVDQWKYTKRIDYDTSKTH